MYYTLKKSAFNKDADGNSIFRFLVTVYAPIGGWDNHTVWCGYGCTWFWRVQHHNWAVYFEPITKDDDKKYAAGKVPGWKTAIKAYLDIEKNNESEDANGLHTALYTELAKSKYEICVNYLLVMNKEHA